MTNKAIDLLKNHAASTMSRYPQYAGHFDNYRMVRIKRDVRTKMGLAFRAGEIAIAAPTARLGIPGERFVTVWSFSNQIDTSVRAHDVEEI